MRYSGKTGIMQGRLSPKDPERLQSFPVGEWQQEFERARNVGFQCLEWLVDDYDLGLNPLFQPQGFSQARQLMAETGVTVESLCAHVFIDGSLSGRYGMMDIDRARLVLEKITQTVRAAGLQRIVLPLMENASLARPDERAIFKETIASIDFGGILLALELDMDARDSMELLEYLAEDNIGLCYDLGNAAALARDVPVELSKLLPFIYEIHIKDRIIGGGSHCLGAGDTPIADCLRIASEWGYGGTYILETPVEDDWKRCAEHNLGFMDALWRQHP